MLIFNNGLNAFTDEGGFAVRMINKTGALTVKGSLVTADTASDNGVILNTAGEIIAIGVIASDGDPIDGYCYVTIAGPAQILLENGTTSTAGNWVVQSSSANGRIDATATTPPGGLLADHQVHFGEVGHCLETKGSGTDVLCLVNCHFN